MTPVFIINLEKDVDRREALLEQFGSLPKFSPHIVKAVSGGTLSDSVCFALVQDAQWITMKGTIGCFLSHVSAWEKIARLDASYAVVVEDDVYVSDLDLLTAITIPSSAEIIFINDRMASVRGNISSPPTVVSILEGLNHLESQKGGAGGDGYLLTPSAARKLVTACETDLYFGHVDGRLLRYATSPNDLSELGDSWIGSVIKNHHHVRLVPKLGLIRGFSLSRPLVYHRGVESIRELEDRAAK